MANSVKLFVLKPYCEPVKLAFLFRKFLILISIIFSKSLQKKTIKVKWVKSHQMFLEMKL